MVWPWQKRSASWQEGQMLSEPPRNGEYLVAAYSVASVILMGYWLRLLRKSRSHKEER